MAGYFGNLKLTDNLLGRILRTLDESRIGQKTAVIVTGDHWWRSSKSYDGVIDKRVPFLVQLPGQTRRYRHEAPFPTLKAGDLVMALLQGRVARVENIPSIMGNGR